MAHRWLLHCLDEHEKCGISYDNSWTPTRLIHVGGSNQEPHLLDQAAIPLEARYMTLSHCWGSLPSLKLTTATLESFKNQIPMKTLPKTFHDAVLVARALNVDYLWIDSLCIMQDSDVDWQSESSEMNNIYKNGICNIAAVDSVDANSGCFFDRDATDLNTLVIKTAWEDCESAFYTCEKLEDSWEAGVLQRPLFKRAWVVQERFLAPRMLHFGRRQVFWECREHVASESCPLGIIASNGQRIAGPGRELPPVVSNLRAPVSRLRGVPDIYTLWEDLVEHYSDKDLTRLTDRFVAISGIAKELKRISDELLPNGMQYLAGLWGTNIDLRNLEQQQPSSAAKTAGATEESEGVFLDIPFTQLLWGPIAENGGRRVTEYPAPSWSWLSMNCRVKMMRVTRQRRACSMVGLAGCTLVLSDGDRYHMIESGSLRLCGWLWKIKPNAIISTPGYERLSLVEKAFIGRTRLRSFRPSSIKFDEPGDHNYDIFLLPITADNHHLQRPDSVSGSRLDVQIFTNLHGLVLKRVAMRTGSFTRVGVFRIEIGPFMPHSIDSLASITDSSHTAIQCLWTLVLSDIKAYLQKAGDLKDLVREEYERSRELAMESQKGGLSSITFEQYFLELL